MKRSEAAELVKQMFGKEIPEMVDIIATDDIFYLETLKGCRKYQKYIKYINARIDKLVEIFDNKKI